MEASTGLAAHVSPLGLDRSGDHSGHLMPIPMASPMPTRQSSSRHPPRYLSNLLHRRPGITVTIRGATTRMCNSALEDGNRSPRRHHRRHPSPVTLPRGRSRALSACWHAVGVDQQGQDEGRFFSPACWYNSSASKAVPVITSVGAVSFKLVWIRCRKVCSYLRDRPNSRARRALGSPLAILRSNSTRVAGRCRVFSKRVPVSSV
jgi:hypothetical protein